MRQLDGLILILLVRKDWNRFLMVKLRHFVLLLGCVDEVVAFCVHVGNTRFFVEFVNVIIIVCWNTAQIYKNEERKISILLILSESYMRNKD